MPHLDFSSHHSCWFAYTSVCGDTILPVVQVRNLGVILDFLLNKPIHHSRSDWLQNLSNLCIFHPAPMVSSWDQGTSTPVPVIAHSARCLLIVSAPKPPFYALMGIVRAAWCSHDLWTLQCYLFSLLIPMLPSLYTKSNLFEIPSAISAFLADIPPSSLFSTKQPLGYLKIINQIMLTI